MGANAAWTVSGPSYLSELTIAETGKVSGLMTLGGKPTQVCSGTYSGKIVLMPAK